MTWPAALINVYEQENVRITGKGVIDGNGEYWWHKFWGKDRKGGMMGDYTKRGLRWAVDYDCERVRGVVVWKSKEVLLKDFTIKRPGFWSCSLTYSDRVHVDGLVIRANFGGFGPSSDGVNTDSSSNVLVENCDIDCFDDNLCIKAGKDADGLRVNRPTQNVVYRDFVFMNVSFAVKNAGSIQHAADWDMAGATLNGGPFQITTRNSTNMRLASNQ